MDTLEYYAYYSMHSQYYLVRARTRQYQYAYSQCTSCSMHTTSQYTNRLLVKYVHSEILKFCSLVPFFSRIPTHHEGMRQLHVSGAYQLACRKVRRTDGRCIIIVQTGQSRATTSQYAQQCIFYAHGNESSTLASMPTTQQLVIEYEL